MDLHDLKGEIVAVGLAIISGIGWVIGMLWKDRKSIDKQIQQLATETDARLDSLEKNSITRDEFDSFAKEIHAHNGKVRDIIDKRFDQMNNNLLWLMHAKDYPNDPGQSPPKQDG